MNATKNTEKRASIQTLGCRLNQAESAIIEDKLVEAGYSLVPFGEAADLGIVNACTVTGEAAAKSRKLLRSFIRHNPEGYAVIMGCYAQLSHETLAEIEGVDLIIGNQAKLDVMDYVNEGKNDAPLIVRDRITRDDFTMDVGGTSALSKRTNLKVQDGCDFMCTFCLIPFARGRARSREMENLLEEAELLVTRGAKEVVLTGVNVGTYRFEGQTILDIVDRLNDIEGLARIRISSIEPTTIPRELFGRMNDADHALVPHLHIPLQSGSDRVLAGMKRKYGRDEFVAFIDEAYSTVKGLCIGTDAMVGFPGESEEDFDETFRLVSESPIAYVHVFKYSEREGTAATRMDGRIDPKIRTARSARLRRVNGLKRNHFNSRFVGETLEVLFEEEEDGYWSGYTGNYIRVAVCSNDRLENEIRSVRLEGQSGDAVLGRLVDEA